jgi:predicted ATPase
MIEHPFLSRVTIRNFKSIAACKVDLAGLMFLVGPNGSGKSNFLNAIRFVSDSLRTSLDHALRERGTITEVRRRSGGHPNHFSIRLDFRLPTGWKGHYSFRIGAKTDRGFVVQNEECRIHDDSQVGKEHFFHVQAGVVTSASFPQPPASLPDRLFLVAMSGNPDFRPVYDALLGMEVYNLNPKEIGSLQKPDPGDILRRDGSNVASVLQQLPKATQDLINDYLPRIVKGLVSVEPISFGDQETIEFRQVVKGQKNPWNFQASSMSDGTLRALGILLSIFQEGRSGLGAPLLIGLEEPEVALHPAALGVLLSALREGGQNRQILVTSHSPDLLDNQDIETESLLAVENIEGITTIAPIDPAGRDLLRQRLFTPGELLRQNQLAPDSAKALTDVQRESQLNLFELEKGEP